MDNNNSDNISIYLNSNDTKEKIFGKRNETSASERYIIEQNDYLQAWREQTVIQMNELKKENEELENDNDRYDKSKRYMKGLLKNLVVLKDKNKELKDIYYNIYNNSKNLIKKSHSLITNLYNSIPIFGYTGLSLITVFLFSGMISIGSLLYFTLVLIFSSVISLTTQGLSLDSYENYKTIYNIFENSVIQNTKNIKESEKELKEIEKSQDWIHEHIDNV